MLDSTVEIHTLMPLHGEGLSLPCWLHVCSILPQPQPYGVGRLEKEVMLH